MPFFTNNYAQPKERTLGFSAIIGTVSKQDSVSLPAGTKPAQLISGDINAFRKLSSQNEKTIFVFHPPLILQVLQGQMLRYPIRKIKQR